LITFDDLIAARLLNDKLPHAREMLLRVLDTVGTGDDQRSLLARLVADQVVTHDQASFVHQAVQDQKRTRMVQVYAHLLTTQGVPGPQVQACIERAGPQADVNAVGATAVAARVLAPDREQQLRFQARVAADRDQAQQVQAYLESRTQSPGAPVGHDLSISGVIRLPQLPSGQAPGAHAVDSTRLREVAAEPLAPPKFEVPDWVDTSDPMVGQLVGNNRVLGRIGAGAMGIVYMADCADDPERRTALKVLNDEATEEARGRFKREILANGFFSHPGVIDVYDAGRTDQGNDFLAMEFFDGEDLAEILEHEVKLEPHQALVLCKQVFETLAAAHEAGIVHRDVKPANILVSRDGTTAKLMDFGIAVIRDLGEFESMVFKTVEGGSTGTPQFMSPEQAAGDKLGPASDLYSMGMVLYQALSGRLPYESETANGFMACHIMEDPLPLAKAAPGMKALPKQLHTLLDRLFDKAPSGRPESGHAVAAEIDQILPLLKTKKRSGLLGFLWGGRS